MLFLGVAAIGTAESSRDELRRILVKLESPELTEQLAEQYGALVIAAIRASASPSFGFEVAEKFVHRTPAADRAAVYRAAGELAELSGEYERAARYFSAAFEHRTPRDPADALAAASAQLDLGNHERAESHVRAALAHDATGRETLRSMTLLARILDETDRHVGAAALLRTLVPALAESDSDDAYRVFRAASTIGLDDVAAAARRRVEQYPDSVPAALLHRSAPDSRVDPFPSPSRVLNPGRVAEQEAAVATPPRDAPAVAASASAAGDERPGLRGIQTGSFRDEENARYMAKDLRELGFAADVRRRSVADTSFHQVIIRIDGDPDLANTTIMRLKERGIEGFLVFD